MSDDTNLAEWGLGQIAGGAFGAVGSGLFGMTLNALGVGFPDEDADAIAKLASQLQVIQTQLTSLGDQMTQLKQQLTQSEYDTLWGQMDGVLGRITDLSNQLLADVLPGQDGSSTGLSDLTGPGKAKDRGTIVTAISQYLFDDETIHDHIVGNNGVTPFYQLYANLLQGKHRFLSAADIDLLVTHINYLQSMQFTQLWLVVEYLNANGNSQDLINQVTQTFSTHITAEQFRFQVATIPHGLAFDQSSGLLINMKDMPYVGFPSVQDSLNQLCNTSYEGNTIGWSVPTAAQLLGDQSTTGILSGYDSNDGTPPQWLQKHGAPVDLTGVHFWTSDTVPEPQRDDYRTYEGPGIGYEYDDDKYDSDHQAWLDGGAPPHYAVDSASLDKWIVYDPAPAHLVVVFPYTAGLSLLSLGSP